MKRSLCFLGLPALILLSGCSQKEAEKNTQFEAPTVTTTEAKRPNFLVIVADDMGYSDLGSFGSGNDTPNLDKIANAGTKLTDFHTAAACAPTRAMLLTGQDSHAVGVGTVEFVTPLQKGKQAYQRFLVADQPTLPGLLRANGYYTMMSGKWHLGSGEGQTPAERGFESSFALLDGGHNHFGGDLIGPKVQYRLNGKPVEWPAGSYSSDYFSTQLISQLQENSKEDRPFFAYLAYTAPHWPLQAPREVIEKYKGKFDGGPAVLRDRRIAQMKSKGLIAQDVKLPEFEGVLNWSSLTVEQRQFESRKMEIHAAMVDQMDVGIGRVLEELRKNGELENTVIIFLSDNGAEGMFSDTEEHWGFSAAVEALKKMGLTAPDFNNSLDNIGNIDSLESIGKGWAQAVMAPYRRFKSMPNEGGIRVPAFISGPGVEQGVETDTFMHVSDIFPTILQMAGVNPDKASLLASENVQRGHTWVPFLNGESEEVYSADDAIGWELFGGSALRMGDWKAVYAQTGDFGVRLGFFDPGHWELFDLANDPGETTDVASEHPEKLKTLVQHWLDYAKANQVVLLFPETQGLESVIEKKPEIQSQDAK